MTEQDIDINIKIAEYMGLEVAGEYDGKMMVYSKEDGACLDILPDYCNDLNAVWDVEEKLREDGLINQYADKIYTVIIEKFRLISFASMLPFMCHATAKQKCEAIIKVLERNGWQLNKYRQYLRYERSEI